MLERLHSPLSPGNFIGANIVQLHETRFEVLGEGQVRGIRLPRTLHPDPLPTRSVMQGPRKDRSETGGRGD